jgi:hypothetical protein
MQRSFSSPLRGDEWEMACAAQYRAELSAAEIPR